MSKFWMVTFNFGGDSNARERVKKTVEGAIDWYRYAPNAWILYSNRTPEQWYNLIQPKIGPNATFFLCELNIENRQGWMKQDFWDWLDKERE